MNIQKITVKLKSLYPGRKVIVTDPLSPTEVICEVEPTAKHPKWSAAIAVIDSTRRHYHKKLTETYHVIEGSLNIYLNGRLRRLHHGNVIKVLPKTIHWSTGKETWVYVYSQPGWTPADHILIINEDEISRNRYDKKP